MGGRRVLLRGHYNPTTTMRKYPNLQKTRLADGAKVLACTQCMKKLPASLSRKPGLALTASRGGRGKPAKLPNKK